MEPHDRVVTKAQRDRLRRTLRGQGCTYEQIAHEMARQGRCRPREAWRHAYGWTQEEVADRFNQAADDPNASMTNRRISDYEKWPIGGNKPTIEALAVLAHVYNTTPEKLVDYEDREQLSAKERIAIQSLPSVQGEVIKVSNNALKREVRGVFGLGDLTMKGLASHLPADERRVEYGKEWSFGISPEAIMESAHESSDHAARAEGTNVGPVTLEQLRDDVVRFARVSGRLDVTSAFPDMVRVRNRIYTALEGHQYPHQTSELYLLAGVICGVLADASTCFGYNTAALAQTRAAWTYAEIIGHNSLRVWCRLMQVALARIDDRPQQAVELARSGHNYARTDISRARLYSAEGEALALTGNQEGADRAFRLSREASERVTGTDELFDDIGGTFFAGPEKKFLAMASGYLYLGMADRAAEAAQTAVDAYSAVSAERRDYANTARGYIQLATAHAMSGQLDAAHEALRPVLALPFSRRVTWLSSDIKEFRRQLARKTFQGSGQARNLEGEAEEFIATMLSSAKPEEIA